MHSAYERETFREFVERVRQYSEIVDVISADVQLRRSGSTFKGLSPFHEEKSPSFVVWPGTQSWYDFSGGGGRGGDVFDYIQQRDRVSFKEAVFILAERAGLRRPDRSEEEYRQELAALAERREVLRLLTLAAAYYHRALPVDIRAEWYRSHYGFTDETVDNLQLGWADGRLFEHFRDVLGVERDAALKTGLFVLLEGGRIVDFFRSRLIFPYWKRGQVVYFTARSTQHTGREPWEQAKYKKLLTRSDRHSYVSPHVANDTFYNEDAAHGAEQLLITEGVTDCISAMQAGVACISPATTRFREQDLSKLLRLARPIRRAVICNDAEASGAGEAGARETARALWEEGINAHVALLPRAEGQAKLDVNELVKTRGPGALHDVIASARAYPEYLLGCIPTTAPSSDLDRLLEPVLAALAGRSAIQADAVLDAIVRKLGVSRRALNKRLKEIELAKRRAALSTRPGAESMPEIRVDGRQLRDILTNAQQVVVLANKRRVAAAAEVGHDHLPLFLRGGALVRLHRPESGPPALVDVCETSMFGYLVREADWVQVKDGSKRPAQPPKELARDLLVHPPEGIPGVDTLTTTPVFGRSGRLLLKPGLHVQDRLWLEADPSLHIGNVPERPSQEEVAAARSLFLDDLFVDFPFVNQSDRAHLMGALLLPFVRRLIDGCTPLHIVEAPAVGAGKGLLCNLLSIVVTGEPCSARTLPETEDEVRKMLTAELIQASPIILLDNAREGAAVQSESLAAVLTTLSWKDRRLGHSQMLSLSNHAMWLLTANNPRLSRDIARRSVRIRLDPKQDRAWLRTGFKHDRVAAWAREHRSALVRAALLLVQAWIAAGQPLSQDSLGSFEHWAAVMGGILETVGISGFLGNLGELYAEADEEGQFWREFTSAWWEEFGSAETWVAELNALCQRYGLMEAIRGDGSARSQESRLGRALQGARDRVFGDLQVVVRPPDRQRRSGYALRSLSGRLSPQQPR
jgi:DNA primase catalytic core